MKLLLPVAFGLLALTQAAAAQQPQQPAEFTLKLPAQTMLVIAKGIQELPYKEAAPVLTEIQRQVNEQVAAASKPPEPPAEPK